MHALKGYTPYIVINPWLILNALEVSPDQTEVFGPSVYQRVHDRIAFDRAGTGDVSKKVTDMNPTLTLLFKAAALGAAACHAAIKTSPPLTAKGRARILIADDTQVIRYGVKRLLSQETGLEVVGEAANGEDAVSLARSLRPDIVIMDVWMPLMDGIEATFLITEERPETLVVGFSSSLEHNVKAKMLKAGAVDYIDKHESVHSLIPTLLRLWAERG